MPRLIGYPFAAHAGLPDRWSMNTLIPSQCLSLYFPTKEAAHGFARCQRWLHDDPIAMVEPETTWPSGKRVSHPTGRWEVRMWYGPFRVWFRTEDWEGCADAEERDDTHYHLDLGSHYDHWLKVPIAACTPLGDWNDQEAVAIRIGVDLHAIRNYSCWRRERPPICLPDAAPVLQTSARAQRRPGPWSTL